jgi:CheY-like chemotaxis protein
MLPNPDLPTTAVLFIDDSNDQRAYWADQLKSCSDDCEILEGSDGQSGLALYRSRRIGCVVLELSLPEESGFEVLMKVVPLANRPHIAVVVLTKTPHQSMLVLAKQNGASTCLVNGFTPGENLDRSIRRAITWVGQMPKEDRYRPLYPLSPSQPIHTNN